jgi:hypothetical protein
MKQYRRKTDYRETDPNTHSVLLPMTQGEADRLYAFLDNTRAADLEDRGFDTLLANLMKRLRVRQGLRLNSKVDIPERKIPQRLAEWERLAHTSGFPEEAQRLMDDMMSALLGLVDPPETDEEKLTILSDQLEAALVPSGSCWPGFDYAEARKKVKTILRYEIALARAGK